MSTDDDLYDDFEMPLFEGPYFEPAKYDLEFLGSVDTAGSYRYNTLAVWLHADGRWGWAHDSGCSCPTPFADVTIEDIKFGDWAELLAALETHVAYGEAADEHSHGRTRMMDLLMRASMWKDDAAARAAAAEARGEADGSRLAWTSETVPANQVSAPNVRVTRPGGPRKNRGPKR